METSTAETLAAIKNALQSVLPGDPMAEAGRKVLLNDFIKMLENETGSRDGADIEHVHDMRVATRRMRSAFRLLSDYFKPKAIYPYQRRLRKVARALGAVRDLDVMIHNLEAYSSPQSETSKKTRGKKKGTATDVAADSPAETPVVNANPVGWVLDALRARRDAARAALVEMFDGKAYQGFVAGFGMFLTKPGLGAAKDSPPVNLTVPNLIFEHLADVRAYDAEIEGAGIETLHALRVEFKRLRYAVSFFTDVLGAEALEFIEELKKIQDHLGELNDTVIAQATLNDLLNEAGDESQVAALQVYIDMLAQREAHLRETFPAAWKHFNSKAVQVKLGTAVVAI